jgi:ABC-type uncharacterized transport system substrate-binding protein
MGMISILYRPNSEHESKVQEYINRLKKNNIEVEVVDVDTREGVATATLYDVVEYPAVLAIEMDGRVIQSWSGQLPLIEEISYYSHL